MESKPKKQKVKTLSPANATLPSGLSDYFSHQTISELENAFVDEDNKLDDYIKDNSGEKSTLENENDDSDQQMEKSDDDEEEEEVDLEEKEIELPPEEIVKTTQKTMGSVFDQLLSSEEPKKIFSESKQAARLKKLKRKEINKHKQEKQKKEDKELLKNKDHIIPDFSNAEYEHSLKKLATKGGLLFINFPTNI